MEKWEVNKYLEWKHDWKERKKANGDTKTK